MVNDETGNLKKSYEKIFSVKNVYGSVHTDFMIGSDEINVTGFDKGGSKTEIIKKGVFKI